MRAKSRAALPARRTSRCLKRVPSLTLSPPLIEGWRRICWPNHPNWRPSTRHSITPWTPAIHWQVISNQAGARPDGGARPQHAVDIHLQPALGTQIAQVMLFGLVGFVPMPDRVLPVTSRCAGRNRLPMVQHPAHDGVPTRIDLPCAPAPPPAGRPPATDRPADSRSHRVKNGKGLIRAGIAGFVGPAANIESSRNSGRCAPGNGSTT
jgi:hypothetical protein